jgi:hypothetical protein
LQDAKEALRIERAKMTREKKQWALDRKAEEKRWAEDMAQLSREKRIWAEEKEKLASPRDALQGEKEKWNQVGTCAREGERQRDRDRDRDSDSDRDRARDRARARTDRGACWLHAAG